jgi:hypothetical protein
MLANAPPHSAPFSCAGTALAPTRKLKPTINKNARRTISKLPFRFILKEMHGVAEYAWLSRPVNNAQSEYRTNKKCRQTPFGLAA